MYTYGSVHTCCAVARAPESIENRVPAPSSGIMRQRPHRLSILQVVYYTLTALRHFLSEFINEVRIITALTSHAGPTERPKLRVHNLTCEL